MLVGWDLGVTILCFLPWPCSWRVDKGFMVPILLRKGSGDQHLSFTSLNFHFSVNLFIRMIVLCAKTSILFQPAILREMAFSHLKKRKNPCDCMQPTFFMWTIFFPSILSFPFTKKKRIHVSAPCSPHFSYDSEAQLVSPLFPLWNVYFYFLFLPHPNKQTTSILWWQPQALHHILSWLVLGRRHFLNCSWLPTKKCHSFFFNTVHNVWSKISGTNQISLSS